jgi:E3 ubiquitin-protein ligase UBR4
VEFFLTVWVILLIPLWYCYLQGWEVDGPPAVLSIMAQSSSIQRIQRLTDSVPLMNLLLTLLSTSYRKVGATQA